VDLAIPAVEVLGVRVARLRRREALEQIEAIADLPGSSYVVYVNAHTLNLAHADAEYRAVLNRAALVLNDGSGVAMAGRMKKAPFPDNLNGSDFNPEILKIAARRGWTVYFLGAREGVAERAAAALRQRIPDLTMAGVHDGYFP
jgi:UDP-N-acetyl-D-mannosaminuronic acid transferase (WecB/TagA/CpsF family)